MKRIGGLVLMTAREHEAELEAAQMKAYNAGKWHSAGGYGKALKDVRGELAEARDRLAFRAAIVDIFEGEA